MRHFDRLKMKREVKVVLKENDLSMSLAKKDLRSVGIEPSLNNMYNYLVPALREAQVKREQSGKKLESKLTLVETPLENAPEEKRAI